MKILLILAVISVGIVSGNLNDFASLLNYKEFAIDFSKEAIATFAENLAEKDSNDLCQDFATFLVQKVLEKYDQKKVKNVL
jgi:hypothetical protein